MQRSNIIDYAWPGAEARLITRNARQGWLADIWEGVDRLRIERFRSKAAALHVKRWIEPSTGRINEERAQTAGEFYRINPVKIDEELTRPALDPELYRIKRRRIVYD
jgi:hypothetical protein